MSLVYAEMGVTNAGTIERGWLDKKTPYSIDKIIVKMSDGTCLTRYAVCVNHCWKTSDRFNLRSARGYVDRLRKDREPFKPVSVDSMREYAKANGNRAARDLLLLGGYGFIEGDCETYDELMKEFERGVDDAV